MDYKLLLAHLVSIGIAFFGTFLLVIARKGKYPFLKRMLFIPAKKSTTNAQLLGGLPIAFSALVSILIMSTSIISNSPQVQTLIYSWLLGGVVILIYGHLDDKFELRPKYKLLCQITAVSLLLIPLIPMLTGVQMLFIFPVLLYFYLATVNGGNLLDGLDTMALKISIPTLSCYFFIGIFMNDGTLINLALVQILPLFIFYYFNKEPAQMHLGEIGSIFISYGPLLLFSYILINPQYSSNMKLFAILPITIHISESIISFMRRVFIFEPPFVGDRLHFHHILINSYKHSPSKASSIIGIFHFLYMALSTCIYFATNDALLSVAIYAVNLLTTQIYLCSKFWFVKEKSLPLKTPEIVTTPEPTLSGHNEYILLLEKELEDLQKKKHEKERNKQYEMNN